MMKMLRSGQRMFTAPVSPREKMFLPSPEGLFGIGQAGTTAGRSSSSSSKPQGTEDEVFYRHKLELENERTQLSMLETSLKNVAFDKLTNEYKGDLAAFQEGEMKKMISGDDSSFYSLMARARQQKSVYMANQVSAKMERKRWDKMVEKMGSDNAINMVLEDDHGNPMRVGPDGEMYRVAINENDTPYYVSETGKSMTFEDGSNMPYVTAGQYMQGLFYKTGYQNGVAIGPSKYYDTYDMSQSYFQNEMNALLGYAAQGDRKYGSSSAYLGNLDELDPNADPEKAASLGAAWKVLVETKSTQWSNERNLKTAVATLYNNLSDMGKKDLRQEWYRAQMSGQVFYKPGTKKGEKPEGKSGKNLDLDTFLYNRAIGQAESRIIEGRDVTTNISTMEGFNKDNLETMGYGKATPWQVAMHPDNIVAASGGPTYFEFFEDTGKKDADGNIIYEKQASGNTYIATIEDPLFLNQVNEKFIDPTKEGRDRYIYDADLILPSKVMTNNGQLITFKDVGAKFAGLTGRRMVGPQLQTDGIGGYSEKLTGTNTPDGNMAGRQVYAEAKIHVEEVRNFRKQNQMMERISEKSNEFRKRKINDSKYIEDWFGGEYSNTNWLTQNKEATITVWVPLGIESQISGAGLRTETGGNASVLGMIAQSVAEKQKASNFLKTNSTAK